MTTTSREADTDPPDRRDSRDRDRDIDRYRERQSAITQRHGKHFNIQLNQQIMRVSDTRNLCHITLTHAAEFDNVNVPLAFAKCFKFHGMECFLELRNMHWKPWENVR